MNLPAAAAATLRFMQHSGLVYLLLAIPFDKNCNALKFYCLFEITGTCAYVNKKSCLVQYVLIISSTNCTTISNLIGFGFHIVNYQFPMPISFLLTSSLAKFFHSTTCVVTVVCIPMVFLSASFYEVTYPLSIHTFCIANVAPSVAHMFCISHHSLT